MEIGYTNTRKHVLREGGRCGGGTTPRIASSARKQTDRESAI